MCKLLRYLPASDHEGVEGSRAPRGRGQAIATANHLHSLNGITYTTFITLCTHLSVRCKSCLDGMGMHKNYDDIPEYWNRLQMVCVRDSISHT